uniref:Stromal cell-derived factor 1 n=1 Tax=Gallus gallus TaxID=9031 RepID=A0A8V0ZMY6_CHICK
MDLRALALLAFALAVISLSEEKPVSLTYRCPCRFFESNVARANIKHLKILSTPNCSLQIVARLKSNSKQVCIDPKLKWIQEYLEKALNNIQPSSLGKFSAEVTQVYAARMTLDLGTTEAKSRMWPMLTITESLAILPNLGKSSSPGLSFCLLSDPVKPFVLLIRIET